MIAFITFNSSLVPLFEGLWSSNPWEFELSGFRRNRTDDLGDWKCLALTNYATLAREVLKFLTFGASDIWSLWHSREVSDSSLWHLGGQGVLTWKRSVWQCWEEALTFGFSDVCCMWHLDFVTFVVSDIWSLRCQFAVPDIHSLWHLESLTFVVSDIWGFWCQHLESLGCLVSYIWSLWYLETLTSIISDIWSLWHLYSEALTLFVSEVHSRSLTFALLKQARCLDVAACCCVSQHGAVCCSVLQRVVRLLSESADSPSTPAATP